MPELIWIHQHTGKTDIIHIPSFLPDQTLIGEKDDIGMDNFPEFMKRSVNHVPTLQQNTPDVDGYYYTAQDGSQMAFWTCSSDRISKEHRHDYDEYMICIAGEYIITINGKETVLHPGEEIFIPKGTLQGGRCKAGTRTIHAFGGTRIV